MMKAAQSKRQEVRDEDLFVQKKKHNRQYHLINEEKNIVYSYNKKKD